MQLVGIIYCVTYEHDMTALSSLRFSGFFGIFIGRFQSLRSIYFIIWEYDDEISFRIQNIILR